MTAILLLAALLGPGDDAEVDAAVDRFRDDFRTRSASARATAVALLARTPHERTLSILGSLLVSGSEEVRLAAAKGLASYDDYRKPALQALRAAVRRNAAHPAVQAEIYRSLGAFGDSASLPLMHRALDDKDPVVVQGALEGIGRVGSRHSIELVMDLMRKSEKLVKRADGGGPGLPGGSDPQKERAKKVLPATVKAMQAISGDRWPTPQEWEIWWARNRATFQVD